MLRRWAAAAAAAGLWLAWSAACAPAALAAPAGRAAPGPGAVSRLVKDLQAAWQITKGDGVTVAIMGLRVDPATPGLAGKVTTGPSFGGPARSRSNLDSLLAAAVAGSGPDGQTPYGNVGMAPGARVLALQTGNGNWGNVAHAIRYAVRHHAQVIFVDESSSEGAAVLDSAVQFAVSKGAVVVAVGYRPAGVPASSPQYPDALPGVLTARAVTAPGSPQSCPAYRPVLAGTALVAAPDNDLPLAAADGSTWVVCNAAAAAAWLASTAVLIKSVYPHLAPGLVARAIAVSARDRPRGGYSAGMGFGMINPAGALHAAAALQHLPAVAAAGPGSVAPAQRLTAEPVPGAVRAVHHSPLLLAAYGGAMAAGLICAGLALVLARRGRRPRPALP